MNIHTVPLPFLNNVEIPVQLAIFLGVITVLVLIGVVNFFHAWYKKTEEIADLLKKEQSRDK